MVARQAVVFARGFVRSAQSYQIHRDYPVGGCCQGLNHMPMQVRPGGVTVHQESVSLRDCLHPRGEYEYQSVFILYRRVVE